MRPPVPPRRVAPVRPDAVPRPDAQPAEPSPPARRVPEPDRLPGRPAGDVRLADPVAGPVQVRAWQPARPPVVSTGSAARFAERVAMRRRLTRRRVVWTGAGAAVAAALGWLLLISPVLALDVLDVVVQGQGTVVDPAAVQAVVNPHDGTPLPRLDTVALRREVLDVPGVRAAQVSRVWPHGLRITVVSREPVAAVPRTDEGFTLLDVAGVPVGRAATPPDGLPVVSVPLEDPGARAMTAVLTVLEQLPPELAAEIATAAAASQDTVRFELRDGAVVEWGSADQTALKVRVLQTLRSADASRGAAVFDLSAPTLPITRS